MKSTSQIDDIVRTRIIADPDSLLEDVDIMRALVAANDRGMGGNVVDLRGIAMQRLETRLDRLEDAHRSVIAAAYENLAGTNQIHRAVLRLLDAPRFDVFLRDLDGEITQVLRLDTVRLLLETEGADDPSARTLPPVLELVAPGTVDAYLTGGRKAQARQVTLRTAPPEAATIYGDRAAGITSEACLKLDMGDGRLPGMVVLGAADPQQFSPQQGTDLLAFFGGVVERALRRWLS